jgi:hypothetical protein
MCRKQHPQHKPSAPRSRFPQEGSSNYSSGILPILFAFTVLKYASLVQQREGSALLHQLAEKLWVAGKKKQKMVFKKTIFR